MTKSTSFATMFNRLPIYTRPREPSIGNPVLVDTTNVRLAGHPGLQIVGLDGRPLTNLEIGGKELPQLPPLQLDTDDDFRPPPPLRINILHYPTSNSTIQRRTSDEQPPSVSPPQPRHKGNISRKPAPLVVAPFHSTPPPRISEDRVSSASSAGSNSSTMSGASLRKSSSANNLLQGSSAPKSKGFTLGSAVKDKVTGRRKASDVSSANSRETQKSGLFSSNSSSPQIIKPPNFISIDDWLSNRERVHKRSNTITSVSTQATKWKDPVKLHIRQSTFAPLRPPAEFTSSEPMPELPPIPAEFLVPPVPLSVPQTPRQSPSIPTPKVHIERPPSPPITPQKIPESLTSSPEQPRDHIQQLEYEQEKLTAQKCLLRKEIYDLKQLLPPNPSTYNLSARERMQEKLQELEIKLADTEKVIHETGMRLHRAWRRRDRELGGEGPTHLWVSRVTGTHD